MNTTFRLFKLAFSSLLPLLCPMRYIVYFLLFSLLLTGCSISNPLPAEWSFSRTDESYMTAAQQELVGEVSDSSTISQSFLVNHDGLHRMTLFFVPSNEQTLPSGQLTFTLRDDREQIVHQQHVAASEIGGGRHYLFFFAPQPDSALRRYTIELSADSPPNEAISVWADIQNRYPGLLALNGEQRQGDLLMEWGYKPTAAVLWFNLLEALNGYGLTFFITLLLWTLPGLAILLWLDLNHDEPWSLQQIWATALALSASLLVILPQFTYLLGIELGGWAVWLLLALSLLSLLLAYQRGARIKVERPNGMTFLYGGLLLLVVASRWLAIHSLIGPQWGDSVHHALITQLLLDYGGIFETYNPYLPLAPFTYHAGFHLLSAWLAWAVPPGGEVMSGTTAILLGGQWLNVMAVIMVGLLAEGLTRWQGRADIAQRAGILALLLAALLTEMPAFYVNWGRYTQLAGQVFLPPALLWSMISWQPNQKRRWLLMTVLVVAGLALTHYRVLMMYAVALPLLLAFGLWRSRPNPSLTSLVGRAVLSGVATLLLILPWYWTLAESFIVERALQMASNTAAPEGFIETYNAFGDLTTYVDLWIYIVAVFALCWLIIRRRAVGLLLALWIVFLFVLSNPYILRLPGTGLVNNFMLQIALYLPLSTLIGVGIADFSSWVMRQIGLPRQLIGGFAALGLLFVGAVGAWQQGHLTEPQHYSMLTHPDEEAAQWLQENTPDDAIFHSNGFFAFADSVVAGSDASWWLWLTANRQTTVPPMVYGHELGIEPNYRTQINERFRYLLEAYGESPDALAQAMRDKGVDYIYIGAQQGRIDGYPGRFVLDPWQLHTSPAFETVYTDELVWIFKVR